MCLDILTGVEMNCPKCGTEMKMGIAIKPPDHDGCRIVDLWFTRLIRAEDIELIDCWKCPKCGHSDDGN